MTFKILRLPALLACLMLLAGGARVHAAEQTNGSSRPSMATPGAGRRIPFPKPDSHTGNWIEFHGASASLDLNGYRQGGNVCLTCHEKNDCIACHNTRPPRDHTNTWRTLSHGFMAEGNRERCITCHRQDFCIRCHNETAPRTHVGNWIQRHCTWCHYASYPVPAEGCGVCHKTAVHTSGPVP